MHSTRFLRFALHTFVCLFCGLNSFIAHTSLSTETLRVLGESLQGWIIFLNATCVGLLILSDLQSTSTSFFSHLSQIFVPFFVLLTSSATGAIFYIDTLELAMPSLVIFILSSLDLILILFSCISLYAPDACGEEGRLYLPAVPDADFWRSCSLLDVEKSELSTTPLLAPQVSAVPFQQQHAWWSL